MTESTAQKNRRIAKNTLMLYVRTFITMIVTLYTSRVILNVIGIDNYGIYNVVGGIVALFSLISGALVNAISRYLTYTLGSGDGDRLNKVFSTSMMIQTGLSLLLIIVAETIGLWFLNTQLNIAPDRLSAAGWVYQLSILSSVLGLMVIPYNACIISHEKMSIYAYFSIIEVVVKLLLVYALCILPGDKLINYALMLFVLSLTMQIINIVYCMRKFDECRVRWHYDKALIKEMSFFAGWNFFGNAANVCNSQGINIILNLFFGVTVNAARGIVMQVEDAIKKFVTNFTTAVTPQITKSYSQGDIAYLKRLMDMSSRFSFYLFLIPALPIWIEADTILQLWLGKYPQDTVIFLRLSMFVSAITLIGNSSYNAMMATGRIKAFQIAAALSGLCVLPIAYLLYKCGAPAFTCYLLLIANYSFVVLSRVYLLQRFVGPLLSWFFRATMVPIIGTLALSCIAPIVVHSFMPSSIYRLVVCAATAVACSLSAIYVIGMNHNERQWIKAKIGNRINRIYA